MAELDRKRAAGGKEALVDEPPVGAQGFQHPPILPKTPAAGVGLTKGPSVMHDLNARGEAPEKCGCSSVVEHLLAKERVESSNLFIRLCWLAIRLSLMGGGRSIALRERPASLNLASRDLDAPFV